jgi:ParB family chromosome partitioning protein
MSSKTPPAVSSSKKTASRGLGRGLSSLLGDSGIATATGATATAASSDSAGAPAATGFQDIPIEWINVGPWQPRRRFDKAGLDELASSIRQKGIVQPILLRPTPDKPSRYQLVAGERRWRAAQLAKIHQVPAIIRELN